MIETLKKIEYHNEQIQMLLNSKAGTIGANVLAPLFVLYLLLDSVPLFLLYTITAAQMITFIIRLFISYHLDQSLKTDNQKMINKYLKLYLFMIFLNALFMGIIGSFAIVYAEQLQVFMFIAVVFALVAGSTSTLSPVYHAVFIYKSVILGTLILSLFFIGGSSTYTLSALLVLVFLIITLFSTFKIYSNIYTNIKQKEEILLLNNSLEEKISLRTKELVEKSSQLEILNKSLDERVKQESKKLRKNEQLLIQQSRQAAMGEMIGNIAHQWRQPLNALGLILQNIHLSYHMDNLNDTFMDESVNKGNKLVQTMSKTIDDFRDFFKPNKAKESFYIDTIIHQSIELVSASYASHYIEVDTQSSEEIALYGYPREFSQVILNIMSNAKDALIQNNTADKKVSISSYKKDETAIIEIEDNAGGIPLEIIEKVFEPYYTTKEEGKGTGIGLYMSKNIIEDNMGGTLSVSNTSKGALFSITFPLNVDK